MRTEMKFTAIIAALLVLFCAETVAKERRGDDLVVTFAPSVDRAPMAGLWAIISTHIAPTLTKVPPTNTAGNCSGVNAWACWFNNESSNLFPTFKSNQRWVFIYKYSPSYLIAADINGDGRDELVAKYNDGTYIIRDIHTGKPRWEKILNAGQEVESADLNGNGKADLVTFSSPHGLKARMDNGKWVQLISETPQSAWYFNLDGKYKDDLVATLPKKTGLFIRRKNQGWVKVHARTPIGVWRADIDGDGRDNIIANFGPGVGTYARKANGQWTRMWAGSPIHVEPADLNSNGRDDLVFYISKYETSVRMDSGQWHFFRKGYTTILAAGDIDANGKDDLALSALGTTGKKPLLGLG